MQENKRKNIMKNKNDNHPTQISNNSITHAMDNDQGETGIVEEKLGPQGFNFINWPVLGDSGKVFFALSDGLWSLAIGRNSV